jgi:hypothetical protein
MSKNNLIALAIAAALASPAAYAVDVTATPDVFPTNSITGNAQQVTNTNVIDIAAAASDNYLGRSTGYNVRVTLSGGAKFAAAVPAATALNGETVTVAGGGNIGDTSVTYSVVPATGVVEGDGIEVAAGDFVIDNAGFLANGTSLKIDVRVGDPVGGNELASTNGTSIASAKQGWVVAYSAPGNTDIRIDVGSDSAKHRFSSDGSVNLADTTLFNAGKVAVSIEPTLTNVLGLDMTVATAPLKITGTDFGAFLTANGGSVSLQSVAACDGSGTTIAATVAADHLSASIPATTTAANLNASPYICFQSDDDTIIDDQVIGATLTVKQATKTDSPAFTDSTSKLLAMMYNGAVKKVWHFNPASNAAQVSYLRITNSSTTAGLFTIDGICDDGTAGNSVTFNMGAGKSILLTSGDIENGNAAKGLTGSMGHCAYNSATGVTAKRRLTITGEVGNMEVQNFLRNGAGGDINTNVNNAD